MSQWADGVNAELLRRENRIAELEAALAAFVEVAPRAIYHLNEEGYLRVCHELEAALERTQAALRQSNV